jgi:hypothetical protein
MNRSSFSRARLRLIFEVWTLSMITSTLRRKRSSVDEATADSPAGAAARRPGFSTA